MSDEVPRFIPGVITCVGGTGEFIFNATGTLDTVYFKPRAPDAGATYNYKIRSVTPDTIRYENESMAGERTDPVGRIIEQYNKVVILNASAPGAVFDIVVAVASRL